MILWAFHFSVTTRSRIVRPDMFERFSTNTHLRPPETPTGHGGREIFNKIGFPHFPSIIPIGRTSSTTSVGPTTSQNKRQNRTRLGRRGQRLVASTSAS